MKSLKYCVCFSLLFSCNCETFFSNTTTPNIVLKLFDMHCRVREAKEDGDKNLIELSFQWNKNINKDSIKIWLWFDKNNLLKEKSEHASTYWYYADRIDDTLFVKVKYCSLQSSPLTNCDTTIKLLRNEVCNFRPILH